MRIGKWVIMREKEWDKATLAFTSMGEQMGRERGRAEGDREGYARGIYEADPWSSVGELLKLCMEDKTRAKYALIRSLDPDGKRINYDIFKAALQDTLGMTDTIVAEEIRRLGGQV